MFHLFLALLFNLVVAIWNARVCGMVWIEANALGGWGKLVVWSAAIQSAIGFTTVFLFFELVAASYGFHVGAQIIQQIIAMTYLLVIVPALGTGLILFIYSWMEAYRRRDFTSISTATLNTITMYSNVASTQQGFTSAWDTISDAFADDDDWVMPLAIIASLLAIGLGATTTYAMIQHYKGTLELPFEIENEDKSNG